MLEWLKKYWIYLIPIAIIFKYMQTQDFIQKFMNHVLRWEGKLGGSLKDTGAIKHGGFAPGTKYHTSKGVTWGTYKGYCKSLGITPDVKAWLNMDMQLWTDILNRIFLSKWNISELALVNPKLAYFIIEIAWMSGNFGAEVFFSKYLRSKGIVDDNIKPEEIQKYLLELIVTGNFDINEVFESRKEQYKTFKNYSTYGKGWNNRLNSYIEL